MSKKMYLQEEKGITPRIFETLVEIAVVAALGLFLARYLFFSTETESRSMEPTIMPQSVVFADCLCFEFREPERFDVVTFTRVPGDQESGCLVRRIVALPGETIRIGKGVVYIDNEILDVSDYISEITSDGTAEFDFRLKEDEYFVLGDTPANSEDSRSSSVGAVKRSQILGKAWLSAKSLTEIGFIH